MPPLSCDVADIVTPDGGLGHEFHRITYHRRWLRDDDERRTTTTTLSIWWSVPNVMFEAIWKQIAINKMRMNKNQKKETRIGDPFGPNSCVDPRTRRVRFRWSKRGRSWCRRWEVEDTLGCHDLNQPYLHKAVVLIPDIGTRCRRIHARDRTYR